MNNVGFLKINGNTIDDIIDLSVEESQKHLMLITQNGLQRRVSTTIASVTAFI